jgi:glyoxylase-like metal-dependent hydrolase (beta-lactamase superfamily II)
MLLAGQAASLPANAAAQNASGEIVARDSGATMHRVATGVYAIIHADAMHDFPTGAVNWPHGNTGVVVGDDAVLVIDSDFYPGRARADIALIQRVTDKPVRYLVNTHWHGDHTHGNGVYRKAFPALSIVGAEPNGRLIALNQARYPRSVVAEGSQARTQVAAHKALLARGADSTGRRFTDAERRLLVQVIAQEETQLREFATVEIAPPTLLFERTLALDLGGRTVELRNWGRANSPADVTVYLPKERVLFTGDILVHPVPYVFGAYPGPWIPVLRAIEEIPVSAVVPGHGPVFRDHAYTRQVRELLEAVASRVEGLLTQGKTLAEVQRLIDLSDLRPRFVPPGDVSAPEYWEGSIVNGLVERTFQCVTGSRC